MRDFFELELGRLHLTTGLQQLSKLSDAEYTELLDLLCAKCAQFPLIPDEEKKKFIREAMLSDSEFLGFNAKILHKWLNVLNRGYIETQADYKESKTVAPPYEDYVRMCGEIGVMPVGEQEYDKPINKEHVQVYVDHLRKSLGSIDIADEVAKNRASWVEEQQRKYGVPKEKQAEIQADRMLRLWKQDCFNPDGSPKDSYLEFDAWRELRFEAKETKELTQGVSKLSEADLTPEL